jgi:outer membrane protein assembly factor BamB
VIWSKNFPKDYAAKVPVWGYSGHPLVYKNLLVCLVGGEKAVAVAFDKDTGAEKWKALDAREPGYAPPTLIHAGGADQVVIWHAQAINGLDPLTGKVHWTVPLEPMYGMSIMAPRQSGDHLYAGGIGACAVLKLEKDRPGASVLWQEAAPKGAAKLPKDRGLYPVNMTPFVEGGTVYGVDQPGMLRAVELETGKKLWFTHKPVIGKEEAEDFKGSGSGTAFVVKNGDRYFLFSETGDLIIAKLTPKGLRGGEPGAPAGPDRGGVRAEGAVVAPGVRGQVRVRAERQGAGLLLARRVSDPLTARRVPATGGRGSEPAGGEAMTDDRNDPSDEGAPPGRRGRSSRRRRSSPWHFKGSTKNNSWPNSRQPKAAGGSSSKTSSASSRRSRRGRTSRPPGGVRRACTRCITRSTSPT